MAAHRTLLLLLCLMVFVPPLFRDFIDSDETRYAEIIREMLESGDWTVPHLNYAPFLLKPPLAYWLGAASVKVFGLHPWVVRLVPLLAAILGVLATYELGAAVGSRRTGLIAGAILATSGQYVILAASLVLDMLFSAFLFGAWWVFWRHYQEGGRTKSWIALFWLFIALACLTKGPLGGAFGAVAIAVFLFLRSEWSFILKIRPILGLIIVGAVNLPWAILVYLRDPRFVSFLYYQINISGVHGAVLQRAEPFYFYFGAIPLGMIPWSFLAIAATALAAVELIRRGRKTASAGFVWIVSILTGGFFLLSVVTAKMETYGLPLYPAVAILTARCFDRSETRSLWERLLIPAQTIAAMAGMAVSFFGLQRGHVEVSWDNPTVHVLLLLATLSLAGLVLASVVSLRGRVATAMLTLGITAAVVFPLALMQAPRLATWRTTQQLCESFKQELTLADRVVLSDPNDYSVPLFLGRRVAVVGRAGEFGMGMFAENSHLLDQPIPAAPFRLKADMIHSEYLLTLDELVKLWESDRMIYVFATNDFLEEFRPRCKNLWSLGSNGKRTLSSNHNPAMKK
jgi:4-amino-4-deoxy-L-arabinose transferase-like glycosyltransferase